MPAESKNNRLERSIALGIEAGALAPGLREEMRDQVTRQLRDGTIRIELRAGNSLENSIRILGNIDGMTGILLEKLIQIFLVYMGGSSLLYVKEQRTLEHEGRTHDMVSFGGTEDGKVAILYFDAHDWLGKTIDELPEKEPTTTTEFVRIVRERLQDEALVFGQQMEIKLRIISQVANPNEAIEDFHENFELDQIFFNPQFGIDSDLIGSVGKDERTITSPEMHQLIDAAVDDRIVRSKRIPDIMDKVRPEALEKFGERMKKMLKLLFV